MPRAFLQQLPNGPRLEIVHELTRIGRGKQCEFPVNSARLGREHSLVLRRSSGFWLCDLRSSFGTWLARSGAKTGRIGKATLLSDGDVIGLDTRLRFTLVEPDPQEQELCTAVITRPDDDASWKAYGEWLVGQGDPRGARIATASTTLTWPGQVLANPQLELSVTWAHGHVRAAQVRELRHSGFDLPDFLRALLWAPAAELMLSLDLELLPGAQRSVKGTAAQGIIKGVRALLEGSRLPALRRLQLSSPLDARLDLPHSPLLAAR